MAHETALRAKMRDLCAEKKGRRGAKKGHCDEK